jgi:hypothetical protein
MFFMESSLVFLVTPKRFQPALGGYQKCEQTPGGQFHSWKKGELPLLLFASLICTVVVISSAIPINLKP